MRRRARSMLLLSGMTLAPLLPTAARAQAAGIAPATEGPASAVAGAPKDQAADVAPSSDDNHYDFLFPGNGRVSLVATTGLPYAALGEVSVGLTRRFAMGALVAAGPFVGGMATGINPRIDAVHLGPTRLVLQAPLIWYPAVGNADNWIVAHAEARLEVRVGVVRAHASVGIFGAKMLGAPAVAGPIIDYGGGGLPSGVQHGALWNTTGAGVAVSVSARTSVFTEGFLIMRGASLAGPEWFALPLAAFLGLATAL
jgi:hypothetical protein